MSVGLSPHSKYLMQCYNIHIDLTSLLLLTISYFPVSAPQVTSLALSPAFISGIGHYIGHLDPSIRRCGMLVAEIVAHYANKNLDFGNWDGEDSAKPWARELRQLITARDIDADTKIEDEDEEPTPSSSEQPVHLDELFTDSARQPSDGVNVLPRPTPVMLTADAGYDSDDSLTGYASVSSRSASPTPSELEEIKHDPTLSVGIKKIPRPVYLVQLGELVRSTSGLKSDNSEQEADKIEMALNCGEELIRKKQSYGVELGKLQCRFPDLIPFA
jgi:telomere length regulation protein